jgi:DNA-binding response OmpR family regulator
MAGCLFSGIEWHVWKQVDIMDTKPTNRGQVPVLIVCNVPTTAPVWGYMIREKKLQAIIETNPENTIARCEEIMPALSIFDLNLQPSKILDLCLKLRAICENPMVVFLPAYDENQILEYYDAGVDECVIKPISPPIFYAKVRAWLRHSNQKPRDAMLEIQVGNVRLDPNRNLLSLGNGREINLTDLETRLLHTLMSRPGHVFDSDAIVNQVWGLYGEQDVTLLKHVVYRLRRKLGDDPKDPRWIQTWHGRGYSFKAG